MSNVYEANRGARSAPISARGAPLIGATRTNVGDGERVGSVFAGGALLLLSAGRSLPARALLTAASGALLYRGVTGYCPLYGRFGVQRAALERTHREVSIHDLTLVQRSVTIGKPAAELHALWSRAETQAQIMKPFADVTAEGEAGLQIKLAGPFGKSFAFSVEIIESRPAELVRWRSLPDSPLPCQWLARFEPAPRAELGTELTLSVRFDPPGGVLLHKLWQSLDLGPQLLVDRTLRNFKSLVEAGEVPSTRHNPAARATSRLARALHPQAASQE